MSDTVNERALLVRVWEQNAAEHLSGGWYCRACDVDCGESSRELCPCCAQVYTDLAGGQP